jgi:poly(hydroxyalkanoate) granule-associated protein
MSKQDRKNAAKAIADSAQQIWLAGLGAFAKAQAEGSRLFDQLIDEGAQLEKTTRKYTRDKVDELRGRMEGTAERLQRTGRASVERIQALIDQRVAQAVEKLAVPTREDLDALAARMRDLGRQVAGAAASGAAAAGGPDAAPKRAPPAARKAAKKAAKKAPAKAAAGKRAAKASAPRAAAAKPAPAKKAARKAAGKRAPATRSTATAPTGKPRPAARGRGRSRR